MKDKEFFKNRILEIVNNNSNLSGEDFFNKLDEKIISPENLDLIKFSLQNIPISTTLIISGKFGLEISKLINNKILPNYSYILFQGGIRKDASIKMIDRSKHISNKAIFFDDSIFGGKTFYKIQEFIKNNTIYPIPYSCYAIYDGCPKERDDVNYLFRYYDFFPETVSNFTF